MAQLREFYRDVRRNLNKNPNEQSIWFRRDVGLCDNLSYWCIHNNCSYREYSRLINRMSKEFISFGLSRHFPFNTGADDYLFESENKMIFKNPKRLKWIKEHCS